MFLKSVLIGFLSFSILHAETLKECKIEADKISGCVVKEYDENGKLMAEIPYLNDLFHGDMKYYTEDKKLLALVKAENGKIISSKCFDDKVLTDKDLTEIRREDINIEQEIIYLKEICLKESDSK